MADLNRPDISALLLAGVAPAWFNILDLHRIHEATGLPTVSVSFEASEGLAPAIEREFDGPERDRRLARYDALPQRVALPLNGERVFVRAVGAETAVADGSSRPPPHASNESDPPRLAPDCETARVVRGHTPEGGRPEPLRVARLVARAGRAFVTES